MTVFTLGYEGLDATAFLSVLAKHDIDTVIDVRELPLSRKPGFSRKSLENLLHLSGVQYVHMAALGCPKAIRDRYRDDGDWGRYTEDFLKHLETQQAAVAEVSSLAGMSNCVLLCYEADANFCHRSMVATAVKARCRVPVVHISPKGVKTTPSALRRPAFA